MIIAAHDLSTAAKDPEAAAKAKIGIYAEKA